MDDCVTAAQLCGHHVASLLCHVQRLLALLLRTRCRRVQAALRCRYGFGMLNMICLCCGSAEM